MTLFETPPGDDAPAVLQGPTERVRLVVAYDGSGFHGFAPNDGVRTVGGTLAAALGTILRRDVAITCAGRTDKGVHARAQVVTFDIDAGLVDVVGLRRSLNRMCGPAIAITDVDLVADDFDARFSATARRYRYRIVNRPEPDPFRAHLAWHVPEPLSLHVLRLACDPFIGEHDFAAFCRRPKRRDGEQASLIRRVVEATWDEGPDGELVFEIEASSFCHQMVRAIVGTMVDAGRGRILPGDLRGIIASGDRSAAGDLAPPQGLMLHAVRYGDWTAGA